MDHQIVTMQKAFEIIFRDYAPLLKRRGIKYREDDLWLTVGKIDPNCKWQLFITTKTQGTIELLENTLSLITMTKVPFRIIKNENYQYNLNAGAFGESEVGKVVTLFPATEKEAVQLVNMLRPATAAYKGPRIQGSNRLASSIYSYASVPVNVDPFYRTSNKRRRILGKCYIPIEALKLSTKGDIYKAVNIKWLKFSPCLVKQGKAHAMDDHYGRTMKDRLFWQKEVQEDLAGHILLPKIIDFFEQKEDHYLVMDFIDGIPAGAKVWALKNEKPWAELAKGTQQEILRYYSTILEIIKAIHNKGYVHRDITDTNFLLTKDDKCYVVDFELSYSLVKAMPKPQFILGTDGFVAPEQMNYAVPSYAEDVYSLGALLISFLTSIPPREFVKRDLVATKRELLAQTQDQELIELAIACIQVHPAKRPTIEEIDRAICSFLNEKDRES